LLKEEQKEIEMGTCRKVRSAFARSGGLFTGTAREHQGADLGAGIKVSKY